MNRLLWLFCAAILVAVPRAVAAQLQIPAPVGSVNDFAHIIPPQQADSIQRIIDEVRAKSGGEIVVVTLPSLQGQDPEQVALQIGRQWKIGQKGGPTDTVRNTGTVLLVVPKETSSDHHGHVWISTGEGTARFFTAAQAGRIRDQYMVPAFMQRDYGTGILLGVIGIAERYANALHFQLTGATPLPEPQPAPRSGGRGRLGVVFWIIIAFVVISAIRSSRRGGRGGGGFGGGGAGGSW